MGRSRRKNNRKNLNQYFLNIKEKLLNILKKDFKISLESKQEINTIIYKTLNNISTKIKIDFVLEEKKMENKYSFKENIEEDCFKKIKTIETNLQTFTKNEYKKREFIVLYNNKMAKSISEQDMNITKKFNIIDSFLYTFLDKIDLNYRKNKNLIKIKSKTEKIKLIIFNLYKELNIVNNKILNQDINLTSKIIFNKYDVFETIYKQININLKEYNNLKIIEEEEQNFIDLLSSLNFIFSLLNEEETLTLNDVIKLKNKIKKIEILINSILKKTSLEKNIKNEFNYNIKLMFDLEKSNLILLNIIVSIIDLTKLKIEENVFLLNKIKDNLNKYNITNIKIKKYGFNILLNELKNQIEEFYEEIKIDLNKILLKEDDQIKEEIIRKEVLNNAFDFKQKLDLSMDNEEIEMYKNFIINEGSKFLDLNLDSLINEMNSLINSFSFFKKDLKTTNISILFFKDEIENYINALDIVFKKEIKEIKEIKNLNLNFLFLISSYQKKIKEELIVKTEKLFNNEKIKNKFSKKEILKIIKNENEIYFIKELERITSKNKNNFNKKMRLILEKYFDLKNEINLIKKKLKEEKVSNIFIEEKENKIDFLYKEFIFYLKN